jgi:heavy metal sensor kinase
MSLKSPIRFSHTLAFRLTLWYAGIFALSSCVAFLLFYFLITSVLRTQIDQDLAKQAGVFSSLLKTNGIRAVERVASLEAQASGEKKIFFRLFYPTGEVFSSSNMSYWKNIGIGKEAIRQLLGGTYRVFDTIGIPQRNHKVRIMYEVIGPGILIQLGQSTENISKFVQAFQKIFITTMAVLVLLAAVIGWFMARRAVSGVTSVTRTAQQISEGDLVRRVPVKPRGDEIDQLATTFNQMLDRIETLVAGIREMSDNIAHDLKSPVTRIRGIAEITVTAGASADDYQAMGASIIEDCDRLMGMINTLLMISKTEAGVGTRENEPLDLSAIVRDACELFQPMAEDKDIRLSSTAPEKATVTGDKRLIQRTIGNLIDNAIKYSHREGRIDVTVDNAFDGQISVTVQDNGSGISEEDLPHIFDRFYRCDQSRSEGGSGLGLSLAKAIVEAHGGNISVESRPGNGSVFIVTFTQDRSIDPG